MALKAFHPFPRLPLEIRLQIYLFATPPRFVHIQKLSGYDHIFSNAPIPALLYTCTESRRALLDHGYKLAFRGRRIWICFADDIVYLDPFISFQETTNNFRARWMLEIGGVEKVRRLALGKFWSKEHEKNGVASGVRMFGGLKELFLVQVNLEVLFGGWKQTEHWDGSTYEWEELRNRGRNDFWAWVECDVAVTLIPGLANGWVWHLVFKFIDGNSYDFLRYRKEQGGDGRGFFVQLGKTFEDELRVARSKAAEAGYMITWNIPSVKVVHVGTILRLKELFGVRDRIWKVAKDMEQGGLDNELTTWQPEYWPGELSPISSAIKSSLEALTSDFAPFQRGGRMISNWHEPDEFED